MRTFDAVYKSAKNASMRAKSAKIESEHAQIISAVKSTFGINDFGQLDESERGYYKSIIEKMWNINEGITESGVEFLNESKVPLTEKSDDAKVDAYFRARVRENADSLMTSIIGSNAIPVQLKTIVEKIEKDIKKSYPVSKIRQVLCEELCKAMTRKASAAASKLKK